MQTNILLRTDSYKAGHFLQYPEGTEYVSSYIESRGGKWDKSVVFGLQMFLKEYLTKPITQEMIDEAEAFWGAHGEPFNREGWMHILNKHNGYLPVEIQAVPEGTVLPNRNVMLQLVNTDPFVPWLTSYLETSLLRAIWYPTTVATNSYASKVVIWDALLESADDPAAEIGFKMHDFGARGCSSPETAALGGCAHLVNFLGTDTVEGVIAARRYYGEEMAGFSIPASEHSTITAWGGPDQEVDAFRNMIKQFAKPENMVACVSDSYDIYNACSNLWGDELLKDVRDSGATLIVRPDSGDPETVPIDCILRLMDKVGYTTNSKGYKVLPDYFRVIQGDGITVDTVKIILDKMMELKLSASNIAFGQGGGLLQMVDRDTLEFAMKASAIYVNNSWRDVYKAPITDLGKQSKRGRLALIRNQDDTYQTVRADTCSYDDNILETVFKNGKLLKTTNFATIREKVQKSLKKA
jgi:nicotinamide phosphoribosyltransferase